MTHRIHNFSAGPCTLPLSVLEEAQREFVNYQDSGMSLIEMSHRGPHFTAVAEEARALALEIAGAPQDFTVLFIQGGATLQFSMVPLNLLHEGALGAYLHSGAWAKGAIQDGAQCGDTYTAWDGATDNYTRMPDRDQITLRPNTRYLHITLNETIGGIRLHECPEVDVPLIGDASSDYMSRALPWERFDIVYGGTQKNLGPAGMAVVFVRKSILEHTNRRLGSYLRYDIHDAKDSMYNTPPVFPIYMLGKVLKWVKAEGGLPAMERAAAEKSAVLYDMMDGSDGYYHSPVARPCRSHMNVVFRLPSEALEAEFLSAATAAGLANLKGHRSVGGCRASIYNAMPREGVAALAEFMKDFMARHPADRT